MRVGTGGFLVGTKGFLVGTDGLRGAGVTLFGVSGALVVVVIVVVVAAVVLGIKGEILLEVTGGRTVVIVLRWSKSGMRL